MTWFFSRENWLAWLTAALAALQNAAAPDTASKPGDQPPAAAQSAQQAENKDKPRAEPAQAQQTQAQGQQQQAQLKPQWQQGQRWIVETIARQTQARSDQAQAQADPVRWEFRVVGVERVGDRDCFRVDVICLTQGRAQVLARLWADRDSYALRQVQAQLPVQGKTRTITEKYSSEHPTPVFGPLTALPIDLPLFLANQPKGAKQFSYEATSGAGEKDADELGFAFEIEQDVKAVDAARAKELVPQAFAKDLEKQPVMEVTLKGSGRQVKQLWRPNLPWPVFSENGSAEARLIEVLPPAANQ
jgi:hypothetical protein